MNGIKRTKKPARKDWHKADIKAALEKAGWTLRKLAQHHGLAPNTLAPVFVRPYPRAEGIVATAIGRRPEELWPSRFDPAINPRRVFRLNRLAAQLAAEANHTPAVRPVNDDLPDKGRSHETEPRREAA